VKVYLQYVIILLAVSIGQLASGMDEERPHTPSEIAAFQQKVDKACIDAVKAGKDLDHFFAIKDDSESQGYHYTMPNLDCQDAEGKTCLHYAVVKGGNNIHALLARGADPLIKDKKGKVPYAYAGQDGVVLLPAMTQRACRLGNLAWLNFVLDTMYQKKLPLLRNEWLFDALYSKNIDVIKLLVERGAQINAPQPVTRDTVLHYTVQVKSPIEIVEYCLQQGVDVYARNRSGLTALDYALRAGDADMVAMLLPYYKKDHENRSLLLSVLDAHVDDTYAKNLALLLNTCAFDKATLVQAYNKVNGLLKPKLELQQEFHERKRPVPARFAKSIEILQGCKQQLSDKQLINSWVVVDAPDIPPMLPESAVPNTLRAQLTKSWVWVDEVEQALTVSAAATTPSSAPHATAPVAPVVTPSTMPDRALADAGESEKNDEKAEEDVIVLNDAKPIRAQEGDEVKELSEYGIRTAEPVPAVAKRARSAAAHAVLPRVPRRNAPIEDDLQSTQFGEIFKTDPFPADNTQVPQQLPVPATMQRKAVLPIMATVAGIGLACVIAKKIYDTFCVADTQNAVKNQEEEAQLDLATLPISECSPSRAL